MLTLHGACYLALKASGPVAKQVTRRAGAWLDNYHAYPWSMAAPIAAIAMLALAAALLAMEAETRREADDPRAARREQAGEPAVLGGRALEPAHVAVGLVKAADGHALLEREHARPQPPGGDVADDGAEEAAAHGAAARRVKRHACKGNPNHACPPKKIAEDVRYDCEVIATCSSRGRALLFA